jgi:plastocyanin
MIVVGATQAPRDRGRLDKCRSWRDTSRQAINAYPIDNAALSEESLMTRRLIASCLLTAFSSVAAAQAVSVTVSEWKVETPRDTLKAGPVMFRVKNSGTMVHGFHVEGPGVDKDAPQIPVGQSLSLNVTLKPGTYELYCPMAELSHKKAGMTRKITVIGDAPAAPKKP